MPDKISDNDIKKALECCMNGYCGDCLFRETREHCRSLDSLILDYINRLEARIGVYETCNARKDEAIRTLEDKCEELQAVIVKYNSNLAKQVAENERLGITANSYKKMYEDIQHLEIKVDKIKAAAYKECIEKVKKNGVKVGVDEICIFTGTLDNLLKELVGEDNG